MQYLKVKQSKEFFDSNLIAICKTLYHFDDLYLIEQHETRFHDESVNILYSFGIRSSVIDDEIEGGNQLKILIQRISNIFPEEFKDAFLKDNHLFIDMGNESLLINLNDESLHFHYHYNGQWNSTNG